MSSLKIGKFDGSASTGARRRRDVRVLVTLGRRASRRRALMMRRVVVAVASASVVFVAAQHLHLVGDDSVL